MTYRHFTILTLSVGFGLFVLKIGLLFSVDPLQLFHKPWLRDTYFISETRFSAAGIINNSGFDSVILGTSMAANFSPQEASDVFGDNFVNISINGSSLYSRSLVLNHAINQKPIKNVILSLDGFAELGHYHSFFPLENWIYLYNDNHFDDIKVYVNNKYLKYTLCKNTILSIDTQTCKQTKSLENLKEVRTKHSYNMLFGGIENWFKTQNDWRTKNALNEIVMSAQCIKADCENTSSYIFKLINNFSHAAVSYDEYVFQIANENPNISFYQFFPPYSRLRYGIWRQEDSELFDLYLATIRHVVQKSAQLANLHVYGFDHLQFPNDLANYRDTGHYHHRFNTLMLAWMEEGRFELTENNVEDYIFVITTLAEEYDVVSIGEAIGGYLNSGLTNSKL